MFCPKCGAEVDEKTKFCPECGATIRQTVQPTPEFEDERKPVKTKKKKKKKVLPVIIAVIVVFILIKTIGGGDNSSSSASSSQETKQSQTPAELSNEKPQDDGTIDCVISDCHISYVKHELVENIAGEKCVAVYFDFSNNSSENKAFYTVATVKAFQDGIELESSLFHVNDESHDSSAEIKPNVKVTVCEAFEVRNDSDIELEIEPWINFSDAPTDTMTLKAK